MDGVSDAGFRRGGRPAGDDALPLYSLVTMVRNGAATIERTLRSVATQDYGNLEYIVVDAGSTDGTVELVRKYQHIVSRWCSEKDRGATDGYNKGIAASHGVYIGYVYADDWLPPNFVSRSVAALGRTGADFVFGDLLQHDRSGVLRYRLPGDPLYATKITYRCPAINVPTISARRQVYAAAGGYDLAYDVAPDYEWLLRAHRAGFRGAHSGDIAYCFTYGGNSERQMARGVMEVARAAIAHGGNPVKARAFAYAKVALLATDKWMRDLLPARTYGAVCKARTALSRNSGL